MRKIVAVLLLCFGQSCICQNKASIIKYINMTSVSLTKNTESYFSNYSKDSDRSTKGASIDLNTIHGARFFGIISVSAGTSFDWNIDKTFISNPVFVDLRLFSNKSLDNCLFLYLQTGKNIKWSNSFDGDGTSSKLGIGGIFEYDDNISLFIDLFRKSKQIDLVDNRSQGRYNVSGFGLSVGVIFK